MSEIVHSFLWGDVTTLRTHTIFLLCPHSHAQCKSWDSNKHITLLPTSASLYPRHCQIHHLIWFSWLSRQTQQILCSLIQIMKQWLGDIKQLSQNHITSLMANQKQRSGVWPWSPQPAHHVAWNLDSHRRNQVISIPYAQRGSPGTWPSHGE